MSKGSHTERFAEARAQGLSSQRWRDSEPPQPVGRDLLRHASRLPAPRRCQRSPPLSPAQHLWLTVRYSYTHWYMPAIEPWRMLLYEYE